MKKVRVSGPFFVAHKVKKAAVRTEALTAVFLL